MGTKTKGRMLNTIESVHKKAVFGVHALVMTIGPSVVMCRSSEPDRFVSPIGLNPFVPFHSPSSTFFILCVFKMQFGTQPQHPAPARSCTRLVRPLLPRARNAHRRAAAVRAQRQKTEAGPSSESPGRNFLPRRCVQAR